MARRRRKRNTTVVATLAIGAAIAGVWMWPQGLGQPGDGAEPAPTPPTPSNPAPPPPTQQPNTVAAKPPAPPPTSAPDAGLRAAAHVDKGKAAEQAGDVLAARAHFNKALELGLPADRRRQVRGWLCAVADKTIFNAFRTPGDPLTKSHVVQRGDTLAKIAKKYHVTDALLAKLNGIRNKNVIRLGQRLKVVQGPFRAVVDKSEYQLRLYLDDVLVREYRVGLGGGDSTPLGEWRVKPGSKLIDPTYFPIDGGPIVSASDPTNPLGEHWIGLEGVRGEAVGQTGYGIHGTIEPDSIGKSMSKGCIRLLNQEVAEVFDLLVPTHSHVTIQP